MTDYSNNTVEINSKACRDCRSELPDLLLDPVVVTQKTRLHLAECSPCTAELAELRATFSLMDEWTAPEPSDFFDTRLHARLREAQAAQPEGFFERMRSFLLFSTGRSLRPAMAGALALVLLATGGSVIGLHTFTTARGIQASATVNDLKIIDNNAQALQQMDQLLDDGDDDPTPAT